MLDSVSRHLNRCLRVAARSVSLLLLLLSLLVVPGCATSGGSKAVATKTSSAVSADARPLTMWEVRKPGKPTSWLFGTCHLGVRLDESLPRDYRHLLEGAGQFVMEVDPSTMDPQTVAKLLRLPEGESVSAMLGEETWSKLVETYTLGPIAANFDKLHPFALLAYVMKLLTDEMSAGAPPTQAMDFELGAMAAAAGVEQQFLETLEEQFAIFLGMPKEYLLDALRELTDPAELEKAKESLNAVLDVCRSGDTSGLDKLREESKDEDWEDRMFIERNKAWVPKLEALFEKSSTFVAVGAGHMFGEHGLVDLLTARGYKVRRMEGVTTVPQGPEVVEGPTYSLEFIVSQMTEHVSAAFCGPESVPLNCHGVAAEQCRTMLSGAIQQCASELNFPAEVSEKQMSTWANPLAQCMGVTFQGSLPPLQESEACSAALERWK